MNLAKCRLWRPPGGGLCPVPRQLQEVPQVALEEGLKVLGIPVGHLLFVDAQVNKTVRAMEEACDLLGGLNNPQVAFDLLRYCGSACRVNHLLRGLPVSATSTGAGRAAAALQATLADIVGEGLPDGAWAQARLPVRAGGLGVACPVLTGPAARVAASVDFVLGAEAKVGLPGAWAIPPPDFPEAADTLQCLIGHPVAPLRAWVESGVHLPDTAEEKVLVSGGQ